MYPIAMGVPSSGLNGSFPIASVVQSHLPRPGRGFPTTDGFGGEGFGGG